MRLSRLRVIGATGAAIALMATCANGAIASPAQPHVSAVPAGWPPPIGSEIPDDHNVKISWGDKQQILSTQAGYPCPGKPSVHLHVHVSITHVGDNYTYVKQFKIYAVDNTTGVAYNPFFVDAKGRKTLYKNDRPIISVDPKHPFTWNVKKYIRNNEPRNEHVISAYMGVSAGGGGAICTSWAAGYYHLR
jgi:hypothetical protein